MRPNHVHNTLRRARLLAQYKPAEVRALVRVAQLDLHNTTVQHSNLQAIARRAPLIMAKPPKAARRGRK